MTTADVADRPRPFCAALRGDLTECLTREWLLTNGRGGFAAGTVVGCPTRRYHALLTAARRPPLERFTLLSGFAERLRVGSRIFDLFSLEGPAGQMRGDGYAHLHDFAVDIAPPQPAVLWRYRTPVADVTKHVTLHAGADMLTVAYDVSATTDVAVELEVRPLAVMRDFHAERSPDRVPEWECRTMRTGVWVRDAEGSRATLSVTTVPGRRVGTLRFEEALAAETTVHYRVEAGRGYTADEALWRVGRFIAAGTQRISFRLACRAFFDETGASAEGGRAAPVRRRTAGPRRQAGHRDYRRLLDAADQFIVQRVLAGGTQSATIIAGYPWFGDWGRDAFIALEGLLLCTRRFAEARQVLRTFAGAQRNGLIPNLFDDYGGECHYNSVDASLWFVHAADRYLALSGDAAAWEEFLAKTCGAVIDAIAAGTDFDIRVDERGLLRCGHPDVQITWMDAKCGDVVFTPRHGCPVEVNALWHHALQIGARRFTTADPARAGRCTALADGCRASFREFLRTDGRGLYDVIRGEVRDAAIRPNQIFAVSLPDSPLDPAAQRAVLDVVTRELLTPYGLRSLAPSDPAYCGVYGGSPYARDAAYHQGTVWSWLIGPYVEAYLRVHGFSRAAKERCRDVLAPLLAHLDDAGLESVSEIFAGDAPHTPCGCSAQAWSVAELIRALGLLERDGLAP